MDMVKHGRVIQIARIKIALLFALLVWISGCTVAPWERGNLAKPEMEANPYPTQNVLRGHVTSAREAAGAPSASTMGGACGCY